MSVRQRKVAPPVLITTEAELKSLERYPQYERTQYRLYPKDIDVLPLDTFLIHSTLGTGGWPTWLGRIVRPNDPSKPEYRGYLSPDDRLIYVSWKGGRGVRMLEKVRTGPNPTPLIIDHIVMPGCVGFNDLAAFKILADTRRAGADPTCRVDLLSRAMQARGWSIPPALRPRG